ncbi:MAG: phage major capsid protein, partial [Acidobacteriota bacterium]|nr:phage major capsid protein [Acidobacteriota bacterium]
MSTATKDVDLSALAAQMVGKSKSEQAALLRSFSKENYQTEIEDKTPEIMLTDEQLERALSGVMSEAKKVAAEAATQVERKYDLSESESRSLAEDEVSKQMRRKQHYQQDCAVAAEVFRAMARKASNSAATGELESARDREMKYLKDTGREVRAITAGTGSAGGYMAPETWNTLVYENLQRVSMLRKYAKWMPMPENTGGIMRLPKLTGNVTAASTAELAATQTSQVTLAQ